MLMISGAHTAPLGRIRSQCRAVNSLMPVTDLGSLCAPRSAVTGRLTDQCMRDLVQQDLLYLLQITVCQEVFGDSDSAFCVIT